MASRIPKKSARSITSGKVRLSQAEATARMLTATSQLLLEYAPAEVTAARICKKVGVHTDYVARYFGSRDELLCQAIEASFLGYFLSTDSSETSLLNIVIEGNPNSMKFVAARVRTIAYLLGCGISPERFKPSQSQLIDSLHTQLKNPKISDRAQINLILIGLSITQSINIFAEVNNMTAQQKTDIVNFIGYLSNSAATIQDALGWDKPVKLTPKKRK